MSVDTTLAQMSNVLVYSSMAAYSVALVGYAADLSGRGARPWSEQKVLVGAGAPQEPEVSAPVATGARGSRAASVATAVTWLATGLHLVAVLTRGLSASRVPWGNMYEFALTGSLVVALVYLGLVVWRRDLRWLGTFAVGPVLLTLGLAVTVMYTESAQLVPALQSPFLVVHVSIAFISSALFTLAFSVHVLQLVQDRREQTRAAGGEPGRGRFMDRLPGSAALEALGYRLVALSFPLWTFTLVAGAIWAEKAWGRYWGWDPKEVWTFVIWVVYAAYLHARATRGWDGRRATYLAIAGFVCVLVNFGVVNIFFSGQHSYAGIG
ncbi:c-type cytochrome biogenesis protein CcsB [Angustibacter speluncae]